MGRAGRQKDRDTAERRCIVTRETQPRAGMIRFVVGPENEIVPDLAEKLPGRGVWVSSTRDALEKASAKGLFARAAKQAVVVPDGLAETVETALLRRVTELLSLARKAGSAIVGYEKVRGLLAIEEADVLIQASDGSERGKSKLRAPDGDGRFIGCLTARELGLAFGREHAIHAALTAGGLTTRVVEDAARLSGLRDTNGELAPERTIGSHERE